MTANVIRNAKDHGRKIGICGQGPSDYASLPTSLTEAGIDIISLNPVVVFKTTLKILETGKQLGVGR